jgi:hypothetical protein
MPQQFLNPNLAKPLPILAATIPDNSLTYPQDLAQLSPILALPVINLITTPTL